MSVGINAQASKLSSIDDYLGDASGRFFGSGYRRVSYGCDQPDLTMTDEGTVGLTTVAHVVCPSDWSLKAGVEQRPHLSTIDALLLAVRAADTLAAAAYRLDDAARSRTWTRRVDIRAGAAPVEGALDRVPVTARLEPAAGDRSTVRVEVASMKVTVELGHDQQSHGAPPPPVTPLGPPSYEGVYGERYAVRSHQIEQVGIDRSALRAEAEVRLLAPVAEPMHGGLETAYPRNVSFIDGFVVALQLGQVLLYELDGLSRADSDTLWMRTTTITAETAARPAGERFPAVAALENARRLQSRDGTWRTATVVASSGGVAVRCSVAHQLPTSSDTEGSQS